MRLTISRGSECGQVGSMRCERCVPQVIRGEKEGACILSQEDDGFPLITLIIVEGGQESAYILTPEILASVIGEEWSVVLEGIAPYRRS